MESMFFKSFNNNMDCQEHETRAAWSPHSGALPSCSWVSAGSRNKFSELRQNIKPGEKNILAQLPMKKTQVN